MDLLEILFEVLPPGLAAAIMTVLGIVAGVGGSAWHSHERRQIALCNSSAGRFDQLFNGGAQVDCGSASLFSKAAMVLAVGGIIVAVAFAIVFVVLANLGKLHSLDDTKTSTARPVASPRGAAPISSTGNAQPIPVPAQRTCDNALCAEFGMPTAVARCRACNRATQAV